MDTLKKLKVVELKQILKDNGLRVGGTKSELISRILENNSLYENDIKISPVYIQKGMTTKQTVPQLKALLKSYGLKVSGRKADLIERLNAYSGDVGTKKISRKEIKPYEKMLVADLKAILKKLKLKVMGRKVDLVSRLYEYDKSREQQEMGMMGMEDIQAYKKDFIEKSKAQLERQTKEIEEKIKRDLNPTPIKMSREEIEKQIEINNARLIELRKDFEQQQLSIKERLNQQREMKSMGMEDITINEAIPIADVFYPIPIENIQHAQQMEGFFSPDYYYGDRIGYKYDPEQVREILRLQREQDPGYIAQQLPVITYDMLQNLLPLEDVIRTLDDTTENKIIFKSNMDSDMYSVDDLIEYLYSSGNYIINGWKLDIDPVDNKIAIIYTRIATKEIFMKYIDIKKLKQFLSSDEAKSVTFVFITIPELRGTLLPMNADEIDVPELGIKDKWEIKFNTDGEITCSNVKNTHNATSISAEIINKKIREI